MITSITRTAEIVTLQEAKDFCYIEDNSLDGLIPIWIAAATDMLQRFTGVAFIQSEVKETIANTNKRFVELAFRNAQALPTESPYRIMGGNRIYTSEDVVEITYTAGSTAESWMKSAVLEMVHAMEKYRGEGKEYEDAVKAVKKTICVHIQHGYWF